MADIEYSLVPVEDIAQRILFLRGRRVILDADLARLYGTTTARLNEQVKRNRIRFPEDFVFQLTSEELQNLISQNATSSLSGWGGRRKPSYAFTEHGAVMAATILKSERAAAVSIYVVRAFIQMREMLTAYADLSTRLGELDARLTARLDAHDRYTMAQDADISALIEAIQLLMLPPEIPERRM